MTPIPELQYFLNTDSATCLTNRGSEGAAPAATWVNGTLGAAAGAASYATTYAEIGYANSLNTNYAPADSFAAAVCFNNVVVSSYRALLAVRKTTPVLYTGLRNDHPTNTMWDSGTGSGVVGLLEPGWCCLGIIFTAGTSIQWVQSGRNHRLTVQPLTASNNITTNDGTGNLILGGAGWASGYVNSQATELAVWKTGNIPSVDQMRGILEEMRGRAKGRGLPIF